MSEKPETRLRYLNRNLARARREGDLDEADLVKARIFDSVVKSGRVKLVESKQDTPGDRLPARDPAEIARDAIDNARVRRRS